MGLAGGMNLYGFAGGDPVNFSDPLGLCPTPDGKDDGKPCPQQQGSSTDDLRATAKGVMKFNDAVTSFFLFGLIESGSSMGVSSDAEATATADIRSAVMDKAYAEGRSGFQFTAGAVTGEEFATMASQFVGQGARLSSNGKALVSSDATFVAKLPMYKTYGGTVGRLTGNLVVKNKAGDEVINAHIPLKLGPIEP